MPLPTPYVLWRPAPTPQAREKAAQRDGSRPTPQQAAHRDEEGLYSAAAPFWAKVAGAR